MVKITLGFCIALLIYSLWMWSFASSYDNISTNFEYQIDSIKCLQLDLKAIELEKGFSYTRINELYELQENNVDVWHIIERNERVYFHLFQNTGDVIHAKDAIIENLTEISELELKIKNQSLARINFLDLHFSILTMGICVLSFLVVLTLLLKNQRYGSTSKTNSNSPLHTTHQKNQMK